jgi:hypothetical protein
VSDPTQSRTSHAKTVDLAQQKNSLDRAEPLRPEFDRAKAEAPEKAPEPQKPEPAKPEFVQHAPVPGLSLKPQGVIRQQVDRQIDEEKRRQLAERSRALVERFKQAKEKEREHGRDEHGR